VNCETDWINRIVNQVGVGYEIVDKIHLWEMRLVILAKTQHISKISRITKDTEATGIAHVIGNKGAVGISFWFNDTSLAFVNSHFAAHQGNTKERNSNFHEVCSQIKLGDSHFDVTNQFHHLFWFGDLNYRIDLEDAIVKDFIERKEYSKLYEEDQLQKEMKKSNVFSLFKESKPKFRPTFKYERNVRIYNPQRIPAWCDRILWLSFPNCSLYHQQWNCCDNITTSDHSPVHAIFSLQTRVPVNMELGLSLPKKRECFVIFSGLKARNLNPADANGLADPYLVFHAPFVKDTQRKTNYIQKTLNPNWDKEVAMLCTSSDRDYLESEHVLIEIMDWDRLTKDDSMGQCVLSLKGTWEMLVEFSIPILHHGQRAGILSGSCKIDNHHTY